MWGVGVIQSLSNLPRTRGSLTRIGVWSGGSIRTRFHDAWIVFDLRLGLQVIRSLREGCCWDMIVSSQVGKQVWIYRGLSPCIQPPVYYGKIVGMRKGWNFPSCSIKVGSVERLKGLPICCTSNAHPNSRYQAKANWSLPINTSYTLFESAGPTLLSETVPPPVNLGYN